MYSLGSRLKPLLSLPLQPQRPAPRPTTRGPRSSPVCSSPCRSSASAAAPTCASSPSSPRPPPCSGSSPTSASPPSRPASSKRGAAGVVRRIRGCLARGGRPGDAGRPAGAAGAGVRLRPARDRVAARQGLPDRLLPVARNPLRSVLTSYRKNRLQHLPTGRFRRPDHLSVVRKGLNRALTAPSNGTII